MSVARNRTLGERIESAPKTILFFLFGFGVLLFGFLIEFLGMPREAGLAGALAAIIMGLAVLIHIVYWLLGKTD